MAQIKVILFNIFLVTILFFAIDVFFGQHLIKSFSKYSIEPVIRISHPIFNHTLLPNQHMVKTSWGPHDYFICTNANGFKSSCDTKNTNNNLDIVFMGDSFTEAIGLPWEDSFVGMYAELNPKLNITNMGLAGYSPSIYYSKIKYFLDRGIKIKHVIVFVDITDVRDEGLRYILNTDGSVSSKINSTKNFLLLNKELKERLPISRILLKILIQLGATDQINSASWLNDNSLSGFGPKGVEGAIKNTVENMRLLSKLLSENNIKLSVGIFPQPNQILTSEKTNRHVNIWRNFCKNRCFSFINSFPVFYEMLNQKLPEKIIEKYYINGDIHFNKEGNQIILNQIIKDFRFPLEN
jgi:hypothetical protein